MWVSRREWNDLRERIAFLEQRLNESVNEPIVRLYPNSGRIGYDWKLISNCWGSSSDWPEYQKVKLYDVINALIEYTGCKPTIDQGIPGKGFILKEREDASRNASAGVSELPRSD